MISRLRAAGDTLYNRVWRCPKGRLSAKLRSVCDALPHTQRLMIVTIMLSAFVIVAFFVFGHACYRIGLGHSRHIEETGHIRALDLPSNANHVQPLTPFGHDCPGIESED